MSGYPQSARNHLRQQLADKRCLICHDPPPEVNRRYVWGSTPTPPSLLFCWLTNANNYFGYLPVSSLWPYLLKFLHLPCPRTGRQGNCWTTVLISLSWHGQWTGFMGVVFQQHLEKPRFLSLIESLSPTPLLASVPQSSTDSSVQRENINWEVLYAAVVYFLLPIMVNRRKHRTKTGKKMLLWRQLKSSMLYAFLIPHTYPHIFQDCTSSTWVLLQYLW